MKEILKQIAWVFIGMICCVIQLEALVFAGLAWVFGKLSDFLSYGVTNISDMYKATKKEDNSEEAPAEGVDTEGDPA